MQQNLLNYRVTLLQINNNKHKNLVVIDLKYNIFYLLSLFYLISSVESERVCPHCGTNLQVKVNRNKGTRFLSCVPQKFGGKGCGNFIENIV